LLEGALVTTTPPYRKFLHRCCRRASLGKHRSVWGSPILTRPVISADIAAVSAGNPGQHTDTGWHAL
jgi:hypothetical protein